MYTNHSLFLILLFHLHRGHINKLYFFLIFVYFLQGFSFQIGYCETDDQLSGRSLPQYTLYLVASNEKERTEWIAAIRAGKKENLFFINFSIFVLFF